MKLQLRNGRVIFEVTRATVQLRPEGNIVRYDYRAESAGGCNLSLEDIYARIADWKGYYKSAKLVGLLPEPEVID
jgi:hypothetical protein